MFHDCATLVSGSEKDDIRKLKMAIVGSKVQNLKVSIWKQWVIFTIKRYFWFSKIDQNE